LRIAVLLAHARGARRAQAARRGRPRHRAALGRSLARHRLCRGARPRRIPVGSDPAVVHRADRCRLSCAGGVRIPVGPARRRDRRARAGECGSRPNDSQIVSVLKEGFGPRKILLVAVTAWLVVAILALVTGPPLGHDEAAFATAARGGAPPWLYRSIGVIWIAKVGVALGGADLAARIASVALGVSVVLATYLAGAALSGARTGAWAAAAIATAHPMVIRSAELIGDLPATACMVAGIAVLASELTRGDGPRW